MSGFTFGSWTTLGSANSSLDAASSTVFGSIDQAGKTATEISITLTYGAAQTGLVTIQIERDVDGINFEGISDAPWSIIMPLVVSSTVRRGITIDANHIPEFRVRVLNGDPELSVTGITVRYRQAVFS